MSFLSKVKGVAKKVGKAALITNPVVGGTLVANKLRKTAVGKGVVKAAVGMTPVGAAITIARSAAKKPAAKPAARWIGRPAGFALPAALNVAAPTALSAPVPVLLSPGAAQSGAPYSSGSDAAIIAASGYGSGGGGSGAPGLVTAASQLTASSEAPESSAPEGETMPFEYAGASSAAPEGRNIDAGYDFDAEIGQPDITLEGLGAEVRALFSRRVAPKVRLSARELYTSALEGLYEDGSYGLGDWKSDLKSAAKDVGKGAAASAITSGANLLTSKLSGKSSSQAGLNLPQKSSASLPIKLGLLGAGLGTVGFLLLRRH